MYASGDTIAAISTAYGEGAIAIVRVSGPEAASVLAKVFRPKHGTGPDRALRYGYAVSADGTPIDEVLAVFMKGPATYTGEDLCEIQCHGGTQSARRILAACHDAGCRYAEPGEFTKLAFLNGRLDLAEAESVIDLIEAGSSRAHEEALRKLSGSLSEEIRALREVLADELVLLAVNMDYPDEDIEIATLEKLREALLPVRERVERLVRSADEGRIVRDGISCAIVGRPNVGKSSLLNAFLREDRAIVTDIPGTTRDTIEEAVSVDGILVRFTDTAGMRETADPIERIGVERSRGALALSDLALFVLDASSPVTEEDRELAALLDPRKTLILLNKCDRETVLDEETVREAFPALCGDEVGAREAFPALSGGAFPAEGEGAEQDGKRWNSNVFRVSAKTGVGIDAVRKAITEAVLGGRVSPGEGLVITSLRQKGSLERALSLLSDAIGGTEAGEALDVVETDVRAAWEALGEIVGETASEDIVDRVFERFCLGK
jgi:tRNA modification GTPase